MQPKRHCKQSSSHSESSCDSVNVITKYFCSAESQAVANANSSSDNSDVIVIESDDELTETEDTISAKSTHYLPTTVASTRNTIVNNVASSSVGRGDSGTNPVRPSRCRVILVARLLLIVSHLWKSMILV